MLNTVDKHNLKVRKRNVNSEEILDSVTNLEEEKEEVENWGNGEIPRVPVIQGSETQVRGVNGPVMKCDGEDNNKGDQMLCGDDFGDWETLVDCERTKMFTIRKSLGCDLTMAELKKLGCSSLGLVNDDTRKKLWPKLLRLDEENEVSLEDEELDIIHTLVPDEVYQQILKDVARSGGHLHSDATEKEMEKFQDELTQLICWVLHRHPRLNYYQGYNDIAATILIVMGFHQSLRVLERISLDFLERFMEQTMEKVNQELFYIYALLHRVHPTLLQHLENVELFPHFALAEYTTWYAHKYAENRKLLHRLFDFFLGSPPFMPLYLSTVIVAHRATEIFNTTPDMGHTHKVLCTLSDDLPFENLLIDANQLYDSYPPDSISNDVREFDHKRRLKELEWKSNAEASRKERERLRALKVAIPQRPRITYPRLTSYRTITVVTILAIGIYAFLKSGTGLN